MVADAVVGVESQFTPGSAREVEASGLGIVEPLIVTAYAVPWLASAYAGELRLEDSVSTEGNMIVVVVLNVEVFFLEDYFIDVVDFDR